MSEEGLTFRHKHEKLILRVFFTSIFALLLLFIVAGYKGGLAIFLMSILIIIATILDESAKETQVMKKFLFKRKIEQQKEQTSQA